MSGAPTRPQALQREVDELRREVQQLQQAVRQTWRPSLVDAGRDVRLAVTVDNGNYPSAGGSGHLKVPIKFVDGTFPQTSGWTSINFTGRTTDAKVHAAHVATDVHIKPGTPVVAFQHRAPTSVATNETDGDWWIIPMGGGSGAAPGSDVFLGTLTRFKAIDFIKPGDTGKSVNEYTWSEGSWSDSGVDLTVQNSNFDACVLPNEFGWAVRLDLEGTDWEVLPMGLYRRVQLTTAIDVNASGAANIIEHSGGTFLGTETAHSITVGNGSAGWNGHRKLFDDEEVFARFLERVWHIVAVPRLRILGKPQSQLQSGSSGTFDVYKLTGSTPTAWGTNTVTARNITGMVFETTAFYEIGWYGDSTSAIAFPAEVGC